MRAVGAAAVVCLAVAACGGGAASRPATTTPPAGATAGVQEASCAAPLQVVGHTKSVDGKTDVSQQTLCCPTDVDAARRAYDGALEAEMAGDYETAAAGYRRAIDLDPSFCDAMDNLGLLYRGLGLLDEAVAMYERSLKLVPRNPVALQNMAVAKLMQGKQGEALPYYERLVALDPTNPEGYFGLGQMYMDLRRTDDAIVQFEKAHAIYQRTGSPYVAHTHFFLGWLYLDKEDIPKARAHFQAAVDLGMEDARGPLSKLPPE